MDEWTDGQINRQVKKISGQSRLQDAQKLPISLSFNVVTRNDPWIYARP